MPVLLLVTNCTFSFQLLLLLLLNVTALFLAVGCSKVSWPALEEPDEYFNPLMQSFSKFPFHDIYETGPLPADLMLPGSRFVKVKPLREWSRKSTKDLQNVSGERKCRICDLLSTVLNGREQRRNAGKKRLRPGRLRKLLKYCKQN